MRIFAAAFTCYLMATPGAGQNIPQPPVGFWNCVVNAPWGGIQLVMQVAPDNTLIGEGNIIYAGTSGNYQVRGNGDWIAFPPEPGSPSWLYKFRMFPQNHAIFSWFVRPTGDPDNLYNTWQDPQTGAVTETACQRAG
jgi:hypothetical protein